MTKAGPVEMPGEIGGLVALDEIVIHGWDLATATGQPFAVDAADARGRPRVRGDVLRPGHGGAARRRVRRRARRCRRTRRCSIACSAMLGRDAVLAAARPT